MIHDNTILAKVEKKSSKRPKSSRSRSAGPRKTTTQQTTTHSEVPSFKHPSNSKTNLQDDFGALHIFKNKLQLHVYKQDTEEHINSETNGEEEHFTLGNNTA